MLANRFGWFHDIEIIRVCFSCILLLCCFWVWVGVGHVGHWEAQASLAIPNQQKTCWQHNTRPVAAWWVSIAELVSCSLSGPAWGGAAGVKWALQLAVKLPCHVFAK